MVAPWREPWARLIAFQDHLPEHYELPESLVGQYHQMISELEQGTGLSLANFRIPAHEIRPRVLSTSLATRRRPSITRYSEDNYCLRTNLLMRLGGLIRFVEPQLEAPLKHSSSFQETPLLGHEKLALEIYKFIESAGISKWRGVNVGILSNVTNAAFELIVDELKRLHELRYVGLRKWLNPVGPFVEYGEWQYDAADFFYRFDFDVRILPGGRPWFEALEQRAATLYSKNDLQQSPRQTLQDSIIGSPHRPTLYVSYAWGDDSSDGARQRRDVVNRLCESLASDWEIARDTTRMRPGDSIATFIRNIALGDRVVVVLSEKYLRSHWCMAELYGIYQRSVGNKDDFLSRVIPLSLEDAKFSNWRDRVAVAKYWDEELREVETHLDHLGAPDLALYKAIQDWHNRVGDILAFVADVLRPVGGNAIAANDFAAVRDMLRR